MLVFCVTCDSVKLLMLELFIAVCVQVIKRPGAVVSLVVDLCPGF